MNSTMNTALKTQHTPGPWSVDFEKHYSGAEGFAVAAAKSQSFAIKAGRRVIAAVITAWRAPDPQAQADARLIAAAPDLLQLLAEIADETCCYETGPKPYSGDSYLPEPLKVKIRAVLAKARP